MSNERQIVITKFDRDRLIEAVNEAQRGEYRGSQYIENLKQELERAEVVDSQNVPGDVVTMNSKIRLVDLDTHEEMVVTLVFPQDADIARRRISVLAPIGTAALGYRLGDIFEWEVPEGKSRLKVEEIIYQPEASGDYDL
jgi:regulator of nucleoside diphosphate kinase